jgi:hypothetical protein
MGVFRKGTLQDSVEGDKYNMTNQETVIVIGAGLSGKIVEKNNLKDFQFAIFN